MWLVKTRAPRRHWFGRDPQLRAVWASDAYREQRARDLIAYYVHVGDSSQN